MSVRLPVILLLCVSLVAVFATPTAADGPVDREGVSDLAVWASRSGSQPWQRGLVSGDASNDFGAFTSVAIDDGSGKTWVAFYDDTSDDLVVANSVDGGGNCGTSGSWYCRTVADAGVVGLYPSVAINPVTGQPGVAYYDLTNDQLRYSFLECFGPVCIWTTHVVESTYAADETYISLVFDATGVPHISYHGAWTSGFPIAFRNGLRYAHQVASGGNCGLDAALGLWQCDTVTSANSLFGLTGEYTSIDVNSAGWPRIAYYDEAAGAANLAYAYYIASGGNCGPGNSWRCITVDSTDDVGEFASLSYASGGPQIAYYDRTGAALRYSTYVGTGGNCGPSSDWQCDAIDDVGANAVMGLSLAVEGDGSAAYPYFPVIAYYDTSDNPPAHGVLKVARRALFGNCGPTALWFGHVWQCDELDDGFTSVDGLPYIAPHNVGLALGLDTNATGLATVAYYDADARDMLVVYQRYGRYLPLQLHAPPAP